MNGWAFLQIQPRVRRAHLWIQAKASAPWLTSQCGTLEPWGVLRAQLAAPVGEFRKCKRCVAYETRRK